MKLIDFSFLADENIDPVITEWMTRQNISIQSIRGLKWNGREDTDILAHCLEENLIILTQDSDFGTLIFRENLPFYGVVFLRPGHFNPNIHISTLKALIESQQNLEPPFMIIAENNGEIIKVRIRQM